MKELFEDIRAYILQTGNEAFKAAGLAEVNERAVVFGMIDPARHLSNVTVAILPASMETGESMLGGWTERRAVTVAIACRGAAYDVLMAQMCGYAETLRRLFLTDNTLGGRRSDLEVGETRFYPDCGDTPMSITGAEVDLTIVNREEHADAFAGDTLKTLFG